MIPKPYGGGDLPVVSATDEQWLKFIKRFPDIAWFEPISIYSFSGASGLGCRLCIARYGLLGKNVGKLPKTVDEFALHMKSEHRIGVR